MRLAILAFTCLLITTANLGAQTSSTSPQPPHPAATRKIDCSVTRSAPSEGEAALAAENYEGALTFFRTALKKDPASQEARLGLVRALIGKNQTADAVKEAQAFLAQFPHNAIAEVAGGEAAFRAADFESMHRFAKAALDDDSCEGRAFALMARVYSIHAYFAHAAGMLTTAHALRPSDELISRDWIESLPLKQRATELAKYLQAPNALSHRGRAEYDTDEEHLQARRSGECRVTSKSDSVKIPLVPLYNDDQLVKAYGLQVGFNGKKRRMQIDTGASGIVLTADAAADLGLKPEFQIHAGGIGDDGEVESFLTHVDNIQLGDVQVRDCMVEVLKKSNLDVDGLIGMDVFAPWLVTLDYPGAKLILNPLPPRHQETSSTALTPAGATAESDDDDLPHDAVVAPQMQDWIRVVRIGHDLLLPSTLNSGTQHYMVMDTGSSVTTLSIPFAKESGKISTDDSIEFTGISGKVKKVLRIEYATLQFDRYRLPQESYYAFDLTNISHNSGTEISGLVGLPTLSLLTITIDYRDNLMDLKYDPKRVPKRF